MKKLKSQAGMTLGEVLISVLILLMLTAIVAEGIPLAQRAYYKVVDSANAQVLLSDTLTVLRDELSMTSSVPVCNGSGDTSSITYYSEKQGKMVTLPAKTDIGTTDYGLVSSGLSKKQKLVVQFNSVSISDGKVTFANLNVAKEGDVNHPLAEINPLIIKVLNS